MLTELRDSAKKIIGERLVSPVLGTFTLFYLVCNWKLLFIAFASDIETTSKIESISKYLSKEHSIIRPVLEALVFIIIYPWIAMAAFYLWELAKKFKKEIFYRFENKTVLPIEKAVALREEHKKLNERFLDLFKDKREIEEKYASDLAASQGTVLTMQNKINELESDLSLYKSNTSISQVISKEEESVLITLNEVGDKGKTKAAIGAVTKIEYNRLLYVLQKLEEKQLIYQNSSEFYLNGTGRKLVYEEIFGKAKRIKLPEGMT